MQNFTDLINNKTVTVCVNNGIVKLVHVPTGITISKAIGIEGRFVTIHKLRFELYEQVKSKKNSD